MHEFYCFRLENAHAIQFTLVENHAGVACEIVSGSEETGMPSLTPHRPGGGIVHYAPEHAPIFHAAGGRYSRPVFVRWLEARLSHPERNENRFPGIAREGLSGDAFYDFPQKNEIDVAVAVVAASVPG